MVVTFGVGMPLHSHELCAKQDYWSQQNALKIDAEGCCIRFGVHFSIGVNKFISSTRILCGNVLTKMKENKQTR